MTIRSKIIILTIGDVIFGVELTSNVQRHEVYNKHSLNHLSSISPVKIPTKQDKFLTNSPHARHSNTMQTTKKAFTVHKKRCNKTPFGALQSHDLNRTGLKFNKLRPFAFKMKVAPSCRACRKA